MAEDSAGVTGAPSGLMQVVLYHVAGAMPQLKSWNKNGPTLYALTITGLQRGAPGGSSSLVGPALNANGITQEWSPIAALVGRELFSKAPAVMQRKAGQVTVVVIVRVGNTAHCLTLVVPRDPPVDVGRPPSSKDLRRRA